MLAAMPTGANSYVLVKTYPRKVASLVARALERALCSAAMPHKPPVIFRILTPRR